MTIKITVNGKTQSIAAHAQDAGLEPSAVYRRRSSGIPIEKALMPCVRVNYIWRMEAELKGQTAYSAGKIHKTCGTDWRYTVNGCCIDCQKRYARNAYAKKKKLNA